MILDKGTCTIHATTNDAPAGSKPLDKLTEKYRSWYGELDFGTDPAYVSDYREDVVTTARIRVHQNREVTTRDVLTFDHAPGARYEIIRVYHGTDGDNGALISDLNLRRVN